MYQTSSQIGLFNLHDSPVQAVEVGDSHIRLHLLFACISKHHTSNRFNKAKTIKPCSLLFQGVNNQTAQIWSEIERRFKPHPEPRNPINGDVIEFHVNESPTETTIKLTGFHDSGWAEWHFTCNSILVSWSEFSGDAWYES